MSWKEVNAGKFELDKSIMAKGIVPTDSNDDKYIDSRNVYFKNGAIRKMYGLQPYPSDPVVSGSAVTGITQYKTDSGDNYIIATCGSSIKRKSGDSWVDVTGTATVSANTKVSFATMNNILIGTDGTNPPFAISGTGNAADLGGTPPRGKYIVSYKGYLVMLNCLVSATQYAQRAYRSGLYSQTSWDTTNDYWNMQTRTGSPITGGCAGESGLVIFKEDVTGRVMGSSDATFSLYPEAHPDIGCISGYTIGGGTFSLRGSRTVGAMFAGNDDLYFIPESGSPVPVTDIFPHYRKLDLSNVSGAVGGYYSNMNQYLMFAPWYAGATGVNEAGYLYDCDNGGVWPISDFDPTACAVINDPTTGAEYMLIGTSVGNVYRFDPPIPGYSFGTFDLDGYELDCYWKSPWFDMGNKDHVKLIRECLLAIGTVGNNSLTVKLNLRNRFRTKTFSGTVTPGSSDGAYDFAYGVPYARAGLQCIDPGARRAFRMVQIVVEQTGSWGFALYSILMQIQDLGSRRYS